MHEELLLVGQTSFSAQRETLHLFSEALLKISQKMFCVSWKTETNSPEENVTETCVRKTSQHSTWVVDCWFFAGKTSLAPRGNMSRWSQIIQCIWFSLQFRYSMFYNLRTFPSHLHLSAARNLVRKFLAHSLTNLGILPLLGISTPPGSQWCLYHQDALQCTINIILVKTIWHKNNVLFIAIDSHTNKLSTVIDTHVEHAYAVKEPCAPSEARTVCALAQI